MRAVLIGLGFLCSCAPDPTGALPLAAKPVLLEDGERVNLSEIAPESDVYRGTHGVGLADGFWGVLVDHRGVGRRVRTDHLRPAPDRSSGPDFVFTQRDAFEYAGSFAARARSFDPDGNEERELDLGFHLRQIQSGGVLYRLINVYVRGPWASWSILVQCADEFPCNLPVFSSAEGNYPSRSPGEWVYSFVARQNGDQTAARWLPEGRVIGFNHAEELLVAVGSLDSVVLRRLDPANLDVLGEVPFPPAWPDLMSVLTTEEGRTYIETIRPVGMLSPPMTTIYEWTDGPALEEVAQLPGAVVDRDGPYLVVDDHDLGNRPLLPRPNANAGGLVRLDLRNGDTVHLRVDPEHSWVQPVGRHGYIWRSCENLLGECLRGFILNLEGYGERGSVVLGDEGEVGFDVLASVEAGVLGTRISPDGGSDLLLIEASD